MSIASVVLWSNGMVMVFDANGEQMPDYQGRFTEVRDKVLSAAPPSTSFALGVWREGVREVTRNQFRDFPRLSTWPNHRPH